VYTIVGLSAFWIEDAEPVYWIVDKSIMMLGGSYVPIALMPSYMQSIANFSPFGLTYLITHTAYPTWANDWWYLLGMQWAWIVILGLIMLVLFAKARRRVSVNGG
jgi:ABC-2 type transport system permease protein